MSFNPGLNIGDVLNNNQLMEIFKCSNSGGMRRAHATNSLVIVSDHTTSIYEDRWVNDIFHYTGMGLEGDQNIDSAQNKTLNNSNSNNVSVFLFEVFDPKEYTFIGQVGLATDPYQEEQPDKNGAMRNVWVFPLKKKDAIPVVLPAHIITNKQERKKREAKRLTDVELEKRAKQSKKGVGSRSVTTTTYERNQYVSEFAKRKANSKCQLCEQTAPFVDKKGVPYLETHHIDWLSEGGADAIENTVALCPNCHRKMHNLNLKEDKVKLKSKASNIN